MDSSAATTVANATQRNCWRWMPRARRKRTTREAVAITLAMMATAKAAW